MASNNGKNQTVLMLRDAGILFAITLIAGLLLAAVYYITKGPIDEQNERIRQEAYRRVLPDAVAFPVEEALTTQAADYMAGLEAAETQFNGAYVTDVVAAYDEENRLVGYVVGAVSPAGYGGNIGLSVGFDCNGTVTGVEILDINETAGLGMNAKNESFKGQYVGQKVTYFTVTKTGGEQAGEIDAITSATVTSKAVTDAVNVAAAFINEIILTEVAE